MKNIIQKITKFITNYLGKTINNQKGIVLPIILMAIGGLSLIGAAAISISSGEMNVAHNDRNYKVALNMAEAGIQDATDAIGSNRYVLPSPLGSVQAASYTINTALNSTGRYIVTVSLPVMTKITAPADIGDTQITVESTRGLAIGDSIIIGNSQVQMTSIIGAINGTTLTLIDNKNQPARLKNAVTINPQMYVARNMVRIISTGQAGLGLNGTYPLASWRNITNLTNNPNAPVPVGGTIRSTVTLQAEYSIQELEIFDSFQATVWTAGNTFNGPMLITKDLVVKPYNKGDFSGPIFKTSAATVNFYPSSTSNTPMVYPDAPKVLTIPVANVNITNILGNAASNAACYQASCSATATQQIYYVNGYQMDVYDAPGVIKAPSASTSSDITITSLSTQYVENLPATITVNLHAGATIPATFNLYFNGTNNPDKLPATVVGNPPGVSIGAQASDINLNAAAKNSDFSVTVSIPNNVAAGGTYYILARPSPTGNAYYNYLYLTVGPLKINSQIKMGNTTLGNHTGHSTILTTILDKPWVKGKYAYDGGGNTDIIATANAWTQPNVKSPKAVLFDGQYTNTMNTGTTKLTPGQRCEYDTHFFIHTNNPACGDQDIEIVSHTIVTFIGTRKNPCNISEQLLLFQYETIWNHKDLAGYGPLANGLLNTLNSGLQPDDADPGVAGIPHKGYYKWVKTVKVVENDNKPLKPTPLMGDREFNSVFNHSAMLNFRSAIVNWNIDEIRMIGWANPPIMFRGPNGSFNYKNPVANSTMVVNPVPFPTTNWLDSMASVTNLDNDDVPREYSSFPLLPKPNGFDFVGIDVTTFDYNGNRYLIDSSTLTTPTNQVALYSTPTGNTNLYAAGIWNPSSTLSISGTSPFLPQQAQAPTTTITATNSGPLTELSVKRGISNFFFDPANGIAFNMNEVKFETKSTGYSQIIIGSAANPALIYAKDFKVETDTCATLPSSIDFSFTGKLISEKVELENKVTFNINTNLTTGGGCLNPNSGSYIYLKRSSWQELRN